MKKILHFSIILCFAFLFENSNAAQFYGGSITYTNVGQDSFMVQVTYYRDCNSSAGIGNTQLYVDCKTYNYRILTRGIPAPNPIDITPICRNSCSRCSNVNCSFPYGVEKYVYQTLIILDTVSCCEIVFSCYHGSRSPGITTGAGYSGFFIDASLNICTAPDNSSPQFVEDLNSIICIGVDAVLNFQCSNQDVDSFGNPIDSFVYEFAQPRTYGGVPISYNGQYAYDKPLFYWGFPNSNQPFPRGFHLGSTGILNFRPMKIEQTVVVVKVSEFRNGIKIGEVYKDQAVIVTSCFNNQPPFISNPIEKEFCYGDTVKFEIKSYDYDRNDSVKLTYISLDHLPGYSFSIEKDTLYPIGTFTWFPDTVDFNKTYIFGVLAKDDACFVAATAFREIKFRFKVQKTDSIKINTYFLGCKKYEISALSQPLQDNSYSWYFPPDPKLFVDSNNFHIDFEKNGKYPIKLVLNDWTNACRVEVEDTIEISNIYDAGLMDTITACQDSKIEIFPQNANKKYDYIWKYMKNGKLLTLNRDTLVISLKNDTWINLESALPYCIYKDEVFIDILNYDNLDAGNDMTICKSADSVLLSGQPHYDSSFWTGSNIYKKDSQYYFNTTQANNEEVFTLYYFPNKLNCGIYDSIKITVLDDGIDPLKDKVNLCQTQKTYPLNSPYKNTIWTGQNVSNDKFKNPSMDTGKFEIYLFAGDVNCNVRDTQTIHVFPLQEVFASAKNPSYCQGDTIFLKADIQYPNQSLHSWWEKDKANGSFLSDSSNTKIGYIPDFEDFNRGNVSFVFKSKEIACPDKISTLFIPMFKNPKANFIADTTIGVIPLSICFEDFSKAENSYISKRFWKLSNQATSTDQKPCTTYDSAGFYDVYLLVENHVGCRDSIIKKDFIHAFSTVSMKMIEQGLTIYPNPFTSQILIKSKKSIQNIRLINFEGKVVLNTEANR
jgi:hypothetical protein